MATVQPPTKPKGKGTGLAPLGKFLGAALPTGHDCFLAGCTDGATVKKTVTVSGSGTTWTSNATTTTFAMASKPYQVDTPATFQVDGPTLAAAWKNLSDSLAVYAAPFDRPVTDPATLPDLDVFPATLELDVIASDIDNGQAGNPSRCAVALAVCRRFDGAETSVGHSGFQVVLGDRIVRYVPKPGDMTLERFISRFDDRGAVAPTRMRFYRAT